MSTFNGVFLLAIAILAASDSNGGKVHAKSSECGVVLSQATLEVSPYTLTELCKDDSPSVIVVTSGQDEWHDELQGFCTSFDFNIGSVKMNHSLSSHTLSIQLVKNGITLDAALVVNGEMGYKGSHLISVWGHQNTRFVLKIVPVCASTKPHQIKTNFTSVASSPTTESQQTTQDDPSNTQLITSPSQTGAASSSEKLRSLPVPKPDSEPPNSPANLDRRRTRYRGNGHPAKDRGGVQKGGRKRPNSTKDNRLARAKLQWMEKKRILFEKKMEMLRNYVPVEDPYSDNKVSGLEQSSFNDRSLNGNKPNRSDGANKTVSRNSINLTDRQGKFAKRQDITLLTDHRKPKAKPKIEEGRRLDSLKRDSVSMRGSSDIDKVAPLSESLTPSETVSPKRQQINATRGSDKYNNMLDISLLTTDDVSSSQVLFHDKGFSIQSTVEYQSTQSPEDQLGLIVRNTYMPNGMVNNEIVVPSTPSLETNEGTTKDIIKNSRTYVQSALNFESLSSPTSTSSFVLNEDTKTTLFFSSPSSGSLVQTTILSASRTMRPNYESAKDITPTEVSRTGGTVPSPLPSEVSPTQSTSSLDTNSRHLRPNTTKEVLFTSMDDFNLITDQSDVVSHSSSLKGSIYSQSDPSLTVQSSTNIPNVVGTPTFSMSDLKSNQPSISSHPFEGHTQIIASTSATGILSKEETDILKLKDNRQLEKIIVDPVAAKLQTTHTDTAEVTLVTILADTTSVHSKSSGIAPNTDTVSITSSFSLHPNPTLQTSVLSLQSQNAISPSVVDTDQSISPSVVVTDQSSHVSSTFVEPSPPVEFVMTTDINLIIGSGSSTLQPRENSSEGEDVSNDTLWPIMAALVVGIPSVIVFGIAIVVIHRRRLPPPRKTFGMRQLHNTSSLYSTANSTANSTISGPRRASAASRSTTSGTRC